MRKMKRLLVIYDKEIQDKGRDSYLKLIKREIPSAKICDKQELKGDKEKFEKLLILKPMKDEYYKPFTRAFENKPSIDIEGQFTNQLTITAEAILRVIGPVDKKTVVIINQSNVLGIPLAKELIERGANVISLNSSYPCIDNLLTMTDVDVLVSASGKYEFKLDRILTRMIDFKVDLSDDLEDPIKITTVPTVEVLKERLEG
ncbi:hypothetical protein [Peptoniphilus harei]|uniref:hypothetical protein n=1 Tax=Peptoniphilus harei TaxID=54005 RepID=UPI0021CB426B|nr:hypothetical protein [Peptoniphilus harei]